MKQVGQILIQRQKVRLKTPDFEANKASRIEIDTGAKSEAKKPDF